MPARKVMTPEIFREELELLTEKLDDLSVGGAAVLVERLNNAAPVAARRASPDALDEMLIAAGTLKSRVRWRWKQQRSRNIFASVGGTILTACTALLLKVPPNILPNPLTAMIATGIMGAVFVFMALASIAESSDWREDVGKTLDAVTATLAKELADRIETEVPYRQSGEARPSTGVRVAPTIASEALKATLPPEAEPTAQKRKRQR